MPEKRPAGLGIEYFNAGRFERAAACFRAALAAGDRAPGTAVFLAHALASAGRPKEAARALTALLRKRPGHLPASLALAALLRR
ncbi:MAG: tetratricopeptide repeat protein, partial [Elusimicrobia bacterium]|nr:tetratricopeptide repeat protein [Elusimicrobiota bacterium]